MKSDTIIRDDSRFVYTNQINAQNPKLANIPFISAFESVRCLMDVNGASLNVKLKKTIDGHFYVSLDYIYIEEEQKSHRLS